VAASQPAGITTLTEGRRDFSATATTQAGETPLFVRQLRFDRQLSNGRTGKSVLLLAFEPITGFVYRTVGWAEKEYPETVHADSLPPYWRVAIAPDRLALFAFVGDDGDSLTRPNGISALKFSISCGQTVRMAGVHECGAVLVSIRDCGSYQGWGFSPSPFFFSG
jgi:hypothetical protein